MDKYQKTHFLPQAEAAIAPQDKPKCINTCINVTLAPTHRRTHAQNKTSILSDASPKRPPGFPAGPNTVEAAQRSRVVTGQELPTGLAPTQTCLQIHQRQWEGPVQTQAPPDSTFPGFCCAPLCCYLGPFFHSVTTFLWKTNR